MTETTLAEIKEDTVIELNPDDFAVVIRADGGIVQYVPGDPEIQEHGVTLEMAAGMAAVASMLSKLVGALLEAAVSKQEGEDG